MKILEIEIKEIDQLEPDLVHVSWQPKDKYLRKFVVEYGHDMPIITTIEDAIAEHTPTAKAEILSGINNKFPDEYELET